MIDRTGRHGMAHRVASAALGLAVLAAVLVAAPFSSDAGAVADAGHPDQVVASSPVSWTPQVLDGYVRTFATVGNTVFSGGSFTTVQAPGAAAAESRANIVAFEKGTGVLSSTFKPAINGEVFKILPTGDGQTIFVAGAFSTVNGATVRSIVKLNATTGARVTAFNPGAFDGRIHDLFLRNGKLIVTGRFNAVGGTARSLTAGLDPTTGALQATPNLSFTEPRRNGTLNIYDADVTPDGSKMIAIGNFTKINGLGRYQIGMIDLANNTVVDWQTNQYGDGCSNSNEIYMRGVEFSRDGSYFVVVTTGAYSRTFLCDAAARWNTDVTGSNLMPEWTNYTGGDTFTAVAITDDSVYVGGHQNYVNNPYVADDVAAGAVPRDGLAALDPRSGGTYSWNPTRERGWGVYGFQISDDGLWVGSDTELIAGVRRARQALLPIGGGATLPTDWTGQLSDTAPSNVVSLGLLQGGSGTTLDRTAVHSMTTGAASGTATVAAGTSQWRNLRGAFMIDGKLYTGWADKTFKVQPFNGTTFGTQANISLQLDPLAKSLNRFSTEDLATITGMFYEPTKARIYFTKSGQNYLYWRNFSGESNIVGAERYASASGAGGVTWTGVQSMFLANGKIYTADSSGNLTRRDFNTTTGIPVSGTNVVVSGPAKGDGQDWRARDAFVYAEANRQAPNTAPTASFTSACSGVTCNFDASASTDPDGTIASSTWDFGDGSTPGIGAAASHVYTASGTYTVTLTVTDNRGATGTLQQQVSVTVPNQAPTASFTKTCTGLTCSFDGSASSDADGTITGSSWNFGDGTTGTGAKPDHTYAAAGTYTVTLTVTDDTGTTGATSTNVTVSDPDAVATVAFRAAASSSANATTTSVTIPATVAAGDQLVLVATHNVADLAVSAPAGWTLLDSASSTTNTMQTEAWTRTATATDAGKGVSVVTSATAKTSLTLGAYSNAAGISAVAKFVETAASTQHATPGVAVSKPGSTVVSYWADKSSDNNGWTLPAGVTGRTTAAGTSSGRIVASLADTASVPTGTFGGLVATGSGVANKRAATWSIVVAPDTAAPNQPPAVSFTKSCTGLVCSFDASASTDADGTIAGYAWNFGDGSTGTGAKPSRTYAAAGTYTVTVTATDDQGATNSSSSTVTVSPPTASVVTFRAATAVDANSTTPTVVVPAAVTAGDVMVLISTVNNTDATVTGPAGWTLVDSVSSTTNTMQSAVWTKVATATDAGSSVRVTNSITSKASLSLYAYGNAAGISAISRTVESVAATTHKSPTVAVSTPGSTLVSYWADKSSDNTGWTLPSGVVARTQSVGTSSGRIVAAGGDSGSLGIGTVGGVTGTAAGVANKRAISWSIVVAPPA